MRTGPRTSSPTCPAGSPPEPSVVLTLTEDVARAVGDRLPLKELEAENARLKNLLAEAEHRHIDAQGPHGGKLLTPNRKRNAVGVLRERFGVSERRGRKVVGIHRSTQHLERPPVTDDEWLSRIQRGLVRISTVTLLEVGYSTRNGVDHRDTREEPPMSSMPIEYLTPAIEARAIEIQRLLAEIPHSRTLPNNRTTKTS